MQLKILFLLLLSPVFGIPAREKALGDNRNELQVNSLEDTLRELLEQLRKVMKEGVPDRGVPPMEPLRPNPMEMDFFIKDTTLDVYLKDMVIRNLSDFEVKNLTATLLPKKELTAGVLFPELSVIGYHKIIGNLFGEIPLNDSGTHRIFLKNATVSAHLILRIKAGAVQISELKANYDVQRISVFHKGANDSSEKEIPESTVKDILDRVRTRYIPLLLNTAKIYLNDLLLRLRDEEENLVVFSGKTTAFFN